MTWFQLHIGNVIRIMMSILQANVHFKVKPYLMTPLSIILVGMYLTVNHPDVGTVTILRHKHRN